jgi:polyhydroxyalkanoate synthesis repressor PhaR
MLVKKYGNRRLYDTEQSRYVRLDEIADRIRAGADVQVVDAKTGADLTAPTLAQIIFEDRNAARLLPVPLLLQLVRMGDEPLADFLGRYVSWALEMYLQARSGLGGLGGLGGLYNPFGALRPFPSPTVPERPRALEPGPATAQDEVQELRREVAALRRSMKRKPSRRR